MNIQIPQVWRESLGGTQGKVGIEYAHLDCRSTETLLAIAMSLRASVALFSPNFVRIKYCLSKWIPSTRPKIYGGVLEVDLGRTRIWIIDGLRDQYPFISLDSIIVTDAEAYSNNPLDTLPPRLASIPQQIIAGQFCPRGHWFYGYCRNGVDHHKQITADRIVKEFPDQIEFVTNDRRSMMLLDVTSKKHPLFNSLKRLKVRTDKPYYALTPSQNEEAKSQLGEGWTKRGAKTGQPIVSFDLSAVQRRYFAFKRLGESKGYRFHIVLKSRRIGITTCEQGDSYVICKNQPRSYVVSLAHTGKATQKIFDIALNYLQNDGDDPALRPDTKSKIEFKNGSKFDILTSKSQGATRGDTIQKFHGSEVPYWFSGPNNLEDMNKTIAGLTGAAMFGSGVLEGTPNGREWFYSTYKEAKNGDGDWWPIFLPWYIDPRNVLPSELFSAEDLADTLTDKEKELITRHSLSWNQLAFRRSMVKRYKHLFPQEFPEDDETCFLTSGICFFDTEICLSLLESLKEFPRIHVPGGYARVFKDPIPGQEYVMGVDTSEGLAGCDPNGLSVLHKTTGEQVYDLHGLFNPRTLAEHVKRVHVLYNNALVGVERENHGHAVCSHLFDMGLNRPHYAGGRMFYCDRLASSNLSKKERLSKIGWSTNGRTRPLILDGLSDAIQTGSIIINDRDLLAECLSFRLQPNGKWAADSSMHDDVVMKNAIAWEMRNHGRAKQKIHSLQIG